MDITFNCNKCGQSLTIDEAGAGQLVDCPKCGTPLEVPYKSKPPVPLAPPPTPAPRMSGPPVGSPPPVSDTKKCPFCAEKILAEARVCRFCGYDLVAGKPSGKAAVSTQSKSESPLPKILALVVLIAIMVGGLFAYNFWNARQQAKAEAEKAEAAKAEAARIEAEKAKAHITLDGTAFIVTKSGENIKLGLVPIDCISMVDLAPYLVQKQATATIEIAQLELLIKAADEKIQEIDGMNWEGVNFDPSYAESRLQGIERWRTEQFERMLEGVRNGEQEATRRSNAGWTEAWVKWKELNAELESYDSGEFYFASLPLPVLSAKTDADGKFQIQVPRSGSYALAASATRHVGDKVEKYYWLLQIDTHGESSQKVMLSNDNLYMGGSRLGRF
jgi:hypothetical protein